MPSTLTSPQLVANAVTCGPRQHFFGYYDKFPWDGTGRWLLSMETTFMDRPPDENDVAVIGLIDTENGNQWTPIAKTGAWNWQQGCMLQWLQGGASGEIIFNDREDGALVSRILNVFTGRIRTLIAPIYDINATGTHAVTLNFSRLHHQRPGYGYPGLSDPWIAIREPEDDGIYVLDVTQNKTRLILSTADAGRFQRKAEFEGKVHRFNHLQFSPDNRRFAALHRYKTANENVGDTRLFTLNIDGSDLCCLSDHGLVSHYDWKDEGAILAWAHRKNLGDHYYLFQDRSTQIEIIGESLFDSDGHCSFSPDRQWVLTDTYPDASNHRTLLLYHWNSGRRIDLGRFYAPPMTWQIRCDLHPRWSPDGRKICIDSIHEGSRQIYVLDVSEITTT